MYATGIRTPAKQQVRDSTSQSPPTETAAQVQTQPSKARRSIGEGESGGQEVSPKPSPQLTTAAPAAPQKPKIRMALFQEGKTRKTPVGTTETSPKKVYANRVEEARACLNKAKANLAISRNIKTDIKLSVTQAVDRLYEIVKEAEGELGNDWRKKGTKERTEKAPQDAKEKEIEGRDARILDKIAQNTELLRENGRRLEEIRVEMDRHIEEMNKRTYASVVTAGQTGKTIPERVALHSVIISSQKEEETGEEILEKVRKAVDAKEGWVQVERVRKAKDRKIVLGCKSEEERRKIKTKLQSVGQHFIVEDVKNKNPLLILRDVLSMHSDEDVVQALRNQNRGVFGGLEDGDAKKMVVKYRKKARNPHNNHIILSVSPTIWKKAIQEERLRIDLQRVRVEDQSPLVQCTRCLSYGHSKRFCKEPADLCSHCGGPHLRAQCPEMLSGETPCCRNCTRANIERRDHNAFSSECPVRKKWDELARTSVAYC